MHRRLVQVLLVVVVLAVPAIASAQGTDPEWGYGVRGGASFSPDQFVIGGHLESPDLPQQFLSRMTLRPTALLGVGSDDTRLIVTMEIALSAPIPQTPWSVYTVLGPGIQFTGNNTGGLVSLGVGLQHDKGYFGELTYLGGGEAQLVVGYVLKPRR
jgi:hypothetical protein